MTYAYDGLGRISRRTVNAGSTGVATTYGYLAGGHGTGSTTPLVQTISQNGMTLTYAYDDAGNITSVSDGSKTISYEYDLLGILKSAFVPKIYIDATDECPNVRDVAKLCDEIDALLCYAYLGDVTASVTGDKKAQKFEDDYLDDVIACLKETGVRAVTYMPTRNTEAQLTRLRGLCDANGLFQVSGEDINSPRQSFVIRAMENPMFANLIDATWKLIEHEEKGTPIL